MIFYVFTIAGGLFMKSVSDSPQVTWDLSQLGSSRMCQSQLSWLRLTRYSGVPSCLAALFPTPDASCPSLAVVTQTDTAQHPSRWKITLH